MTGAGRVRELLSTVFTKALEEADKQGFERIKFTRAGNLYAKEFGLSSTGGARVYNLMLKKYLRTTGWHTKRIEPGAGGSDTEWTIVKGESSGEPEIKRDDFLVAAKDQATFQESGIRELYDYFIMGNEHPYGLSEAQMNRMLEANLNHPDLDAMMENLFRSETNELIGHLREHKVKLDEEAHEKANATEVDPEAMPDVTFEDVAEAIEATAEEVEAEEPKVDAGDGGDEPPKEPPTDKGPDEEPGDGADKRKELITDFIKKLNKKMGEDGMTRLLDIGKPEGMLPKGAKMPNLRSTDLIKEYDDALEGNGVGNHAIRDRSEQYVNTNMTNTADARRQGATGTDIDILVGQSGGNIDSSLERRFSDSDFEDELGNEIAQIFADNMDFASNVITNARNMGARVKIQGILNEAFGRGISMQDLFAQAERSLIEIIQTDAKNGNVSGPKQAALVEEAQEAIKQMKLMYLQTLGIPVTQFDATSGTARAMNISKNLAYSKLGGSFSQMVALVEAPFAVLRTGGMGPMQIVRNMSNFLGGLVAAAGDFAGTNIPGVGKMMSAMGIDNDGARWIARDLVTYMENFDGTSALARFGFTGDHGNLAAFTFGDRLRASHERVKSTGSREVIGDDTPWTGSTIEAGTAAIADWTGALSAMEQVTDIARSIGINIGRVSLSKYGDKLIQLAQKIEGLGSQVDDKTMIGFARELGIPKNIAVRAGHAGLLENGGKSLEVLRDVGGVRYGSSDGGQIDLNQFNTKIQEVQQARRQQGFLNESSQAEFAAQNAAIETVQEYLLQFGRQASPEAKGSQAIGRGDPVTQFLFSMLSYPMTAYQELVVNGVKTSNLASMAGTLALLAAFEFNARMIRAMNDGTEEERKEAQELYKRVLSGDLSEREYFHVLANYGTMSPAFGHFGGWVGDIMTTGVEAISPPQPGDSSDFRKVFANKAFNSPVIGTTQGTVSSLMAGGKELAKMIGGQDPETMAKAKQRERRLASGLATAIDNFTPFNSGFFQAASQLAGGHKVGELAALSLMQGYRGYNANAPGATLPGMLEGRSMRQYNQVNQYDNPAMAPDYQKRMMGAMNALSTMPEAWKSKAEQSPSAGLADSLGDE
jgi:hypothetical protein